MNRFEQRSKNSYDKKADHYDSTFDGKFTSRFKEILCQSVSIHANDTVADIACGNGRLLQMLAEKNSFQGYGVDLSEKMVEQAKKRNPDMEFYAARCEELPFPDETVDIMVVCAAFHHFPDPEGFAREARRGIREEGMLYIADVCLPAVLRVIANPFLQFSRSGDVKFYAPQEIASLFEKHGFQARGVEIHGIIQVIQMQKSSK